MPDETARINAVVPDALKHDLQRVLLTERMTITQWLIAQMQRTVDEHKVMRGERE